jgi:hypothetical protein
VTAHALDPTVRRLARFRAKLAHAPLGTLAELACRAGYVARGFVYLSIGAIAVLAAADLTPRAEGSLGALEAWADWPFGVVLLWLTGLGLYGFAGWRLLQSVFDADRQGRSAKALAARAGQALSGVVYGGLAISTFGVLDALEDLGEVDDRAETQESVAQMLAMPGGEWMVMAAGAFVIGAGIGAIVQAFGRDLCKPLGCDRDTRRWAAWLGRVGYFGRGLAFLPAGGFLLLAGWRARSEEARGLGGALQWVEQAPFGGPLLALIALGLIAFGLFALVEARFRRMHVDDVIET